ncbi:MAG: hypothetical protein M3R13_02510 [Armatimonadota bacterium]|nr:hypothetical protein [Armatimonadota bacterium]
MEPLDLVAEDIQSRLRKAHVLRQRGDALGADNALRELSEAYPDHPETTLLRAEALEREGKLKEARDLLAGVIAGETKSLAAERKHAELVLKVAGRDYAVSALMNDDFASLMSPDGVKRNPGTAAFFSMLLPGFGQIYNAQVVKGIIFMVAAVFFWTGLLKFGVGQKTVTEWFWPSLTGLGLVYVVAILDAAVKAGKGGQAIRPVRPTPPIDKPFE